MVELLVALTVLGVLTGLAGVTIASLRVPPEAEFLDALRAARHDAIVNGQAVMWEHGTLCVRFLPDGSSSGGTFELEGTRIWMDPLTGVIRALE